MKFKEILSKLHPTQKLKWYEGGDLTGREYTVENLRKWNDEGKYSSVSGDFTLTQSGNEIFIIKHNHYLNLPNYNDQVKVDVVMFSGTLEFV